MLIGLVDLFSETLIEIVLLLLPIIILEVLGDDHAAGQGTERDLNQGGGLIDNIV